MLSIEAIASSRNKIMAHYAKKLGYDEDQISTFVAVLDSIKTIMDEKVRPNIMEWDRVGTKLMDGKVVFPPKYEETMNELMVDNEMLAFFVPEKFGGYGYENVFQAALTELMAQYDIPLQISTTISFSVLEAMIIYHNPVFDPIIQEFIDLKIFTSLVVKNYNNIFIKFTIKRNTVFEKLVKRCHLSVITFCFDFDFKDKIINF